MQIATLSSCAWNDVQLPRAAFASQELSVIIQVMARASLQRVRWPRTGLS